MYRGSPRLPKRLGTLRGKSYARVQPLTQQRRAGRALPAQWTCPGALEADSYSAAGKRIFSLFQGCDRLKTGHGGIEVAHPTSGAHQRAAR